MRSTLRSLFIVPLFVLLSGAPAALHAGRLDEGLEMFLSSLPDDAPVSVIVALKQQADIPGIDRALVREKATRQSRHERVVRALRETAARTQPPLIEYLTAAKAKGDVFGFSPHWISNLIVVHASKREVLRLRDHPDVGSIEKNFEYGLIEPVTAGGGGPIETGIGVTPGLRAINADRVWHELGITGNGTLVANLDTGVDGNHPALSARWRGNDPGVDWSDAWLDVVYGGSQFPADFYSHGTHVMGTITGLGAATGDTIGVAWRAKWIACNAIDQYAGVEFDNDVLVGLEWLADPDGDPFTIDDVPDVVQNSWGINEGFSSTPPYTDCDDRWWAAIDNCEAAGVVITWSAGNEGPGSGSLRSPADRADTPYNVFSIGAVDATNSPYPYPIASFSSRGPSGCGGPYDIKPEVCAPGVDVYSSVPGGGYQGGWSGTSMAGPHVAGVVALMREANPNLTVDQIKDVLMQTAHDFGNSGEDNTYGMGFIDAYESVLMVMSGVAYVVGTVTDAGTGEPIPAAMEVVGADRAVTADPVTGLYSFILPGDSTYTIQASYFGYETMQQSIYLPPDDSTSLDFPMALLPSGHLAGMVMDGGSGLPIEGATVEVLDTPLDPAVTEARGVFSLGLIPGETAYDVSTSAAGYGTNIETKAIVAGSLNILALPLSVDYFDDMESGTNGYTHGIVTPGFGDQWHQATNRNVTPTGHTSWKCGATGGGDYADLLDAGLETPDIALRNNSRLLFWSWMDAEPTGNEAWDGGIVEISIDGGAYEQITPVDGYPYTIRDSGNPLPGGTPCFSGNIRTWRRHEFDLSGYSGNATFRFRFGSDGSVSYEGWYIDEVIVAPDAPTAPVSILLLPDDPDIQIGPAGGSFTWQMALVNNTSQTQIFDWWTDVSLGDTVVFGPIETHTDTLSADETRILPARMQDVPGSTPARTYNYNGRLGLLPDLWKAISSFQFTKTGAVGSERPAGEAWELPAPRAGD